MAVTALFLLLPLLTALIVWAGDGRTAIYHHMRVGRDGCRSGGLKFRPSTTNGDAVLVIQIFPVYLETV